MLSHACKALSKSSNRAAAGRGRSLASTECMVQAAPDVLSGASARLLTLAQAMALVHFPDVAGVTCAAYFLTGAVLESLQTLRGPPAAQGRGCCSKVGMLCE